LEPEGSNGLVKRSLLRLDFIMTIPEELIGRKIGILSTSLMNEVEGRLKRLFDIKST
jgi:mRNA-degrading endonuclease toxin of MazEF toxin-antitoxin module